jgi:hypothetical protein
MRHSPSAAFAEENDVAVSNVRRNEKSKKEQRLKTGDHWRASVDIYQVSAVDC